MLQVTSNPGLLQMLNNKASRVLGRLLLSSLAMNLLPQLMKILNRADCQMSRTVIHLSRHLKREKTMKKTNRFALLAVLGAVLGSALIMGCGGGDTEETTTTNSANGTESTTTTTEE
jgi:hypothetical protein